MTAATTSRVTDLCCLACGHRPGYVQDGFVRAADPAQADAVKRLRCPSCIGGRLMSDDVREVYNRAPLPTDRCGCGNVVAAGEASHCATCARRTRTLERTRAARERQRSGVAG